MEAGDEVGCMAWEGEKTKLDPRDLKLIAARNWLDQFVVTDKIYKWNIPTDKQMDDLLRILT